MRPYTRPYINVMIATMSDSIAKIGRNLIDTFGQGWSRTHVDTLLSVFAPEARFIETPFAEPLVGVEAIREYWREIPYYQSEITFTSGANAGKRVTRSARCGCTGTGGETNND